MKNGKYTLSELSEYCFLLRNDIHWMHLNTSGLKFNSFHEMLNEFYDDLLEFYDALSEMAISHGENIVNPSILILDYEDEYEVEVDDTYDAESICKVLDTKGRDFLEKVLNIKDYESFVHSRIDSFSEKIDSLINYRIKQMMK